MRRLLLAALALLAAGLARGADSATACSAVFPNGLTSHEVGSKLVFERNAQLFNAPTNVLNFSSIEEDRGRPTCDSSDCLAGNTVSETLDPGPFQASGSSTDFEAPDDGTTLTQPRYEDVKVDSGTLGVSASHSSYFVDKLEVEKNAGLNLRPGDYWIDTLELKENSRLDVSGGSGTVRIYVNTLKIEKNAEVNIAGDPSRLFLHVYEDDVDIKENVSFAGFLYARSKVLIGRNSRVSGAVSAAEEVKLERGASVTYDGTAIADADFGCLCSCRGPAPILDLAMNEPVWNGTAGEVVDQVAGNNGRAVNGPVTQSATPAVPGNPGTCRYGAFDGNNDYLQFADAAHLDLPRELTVAIWINLRNIPASGLKSFVSKDTNYEFHVDSAARLYWWWNDAGGTTRSFTSSARVSTNRWHHVAFTYRSGSQVMYLDGVAVGSTTFSGNLITNNLPLQIGQDQNFAGRFWDGLLDELKIFDRALSASQVAAVMKETRPCAAGVVGLRIDHDGAGIHCVDEPMTVTALTAGGATATGYAEQITLRTDTGRGTYALLSGNGVLDDGSPDDGIATYQYVGADGGTATFALSYRQGSALVDIDAEQTSNPTVADDDSEGPLVFAPSGFTITGSVLPNPPPSPIVDPVPTQVAGAPFPVHITAFGVTDDDPVCGVIESYGGDRSLTFGMTHVNPNSGTRFVTVDGEPVGTGTAQTVTFNGGQAMVKTGYKDVGSIRLSVQDAASFPNTLTGSTNTFVVKPAELRISRIQSAAGVDNPEAATASGPRFVPAGQAFEVDVDVLDADGDLTPNYGRETPAQGLRVVSEVLVVPASGGRNGSTGDVQNGASFAPTAPPGRFSNAGVVFDEVGAIRLRPAMDDGDYLGTGPVPGVLSNPVGRFYPASFGLLTSAVGAACASFTYMDQPQMSLQYVVQALTTGGAVTENYDTALLGAGAVASPRLTAEAADDGVDRAARLTAPGGAWVDGELSVNRSDLRFARLAAPDGPFDPLDIGLAVDDPLDGVLLANRNTNPLTSGDCILAGDCSGRSLGSTRVVYGRLAVLPASGPENENLKIPLVAQAFTGAAFESHGADSCTVYAAAGVTLSDYTGNLTASDTGVIGPAGVPTLVTGAADPADPLELAAPDFGNDGTVTVILDVDTWLEFDWRGTGLEDPRGVAAFGRYRGHDRIIFWGEPGS